jgi:hypothetical protein
MLFFFFKALDSIFAQSADQWSCTAPDGSARVWVAQPASALQRLLSGSKHAIPGGLRLWRSVWRARPSVGWLLLVRIPSLFGFVLFCLFEVVFSCLSV